MGFRLQRIREASASRSRQIETKLIGETAQSLDSRRLEAHNRPPVGPKIGRMDADSATVDAIKPNRADRTQIGRFGPPKIVRGSSTERAWAPKILQEALAQLTKARKSFDLVHGAPQGAKCRAAGKLPTAFRISFYSVLSISSQVTNKRVSATKT